MSPPPPIYLHPSPHSTILPALLPLLPSPLPIIRRIQSHFQTTSAHLLATFPPSPTASAPPPRPFALAYCDRSRAPETECFIFSSVELASPAQVRSESEDVGRDVERRQVLALLAHIARLPLPVGFEGEGGVLLVGALHEAVLELVRGDKSGLMPDAMGSAMGVVSCCSESWRKFLVAPGAGAGAEDGMGRGLESRGLRFGRVGSGKGDLARVMSRLVIPRRERTLRMLPGVAVRKIVDGDRKGEGEMAAWGFWGVDGSVTALHVEEEVRGKGLGKAVTARLLQTLVEGEWEEGEDGEKGNWKGFVGLTKEQAWTHLDVGEKNVASIAVAKGLGGTEAWLVFWTWMDLGRAVKELEEMT